MKVVRELHLVARTLYTLAAVFAFSGLNGFTFLTGLMTIGWIIFLSSFMWQYYVLHFALQNISSTRGRLLFLIGWCLVTLAGVVFAAIMTPTLAELNNYESEDAFLKSAAFWGSIFVSFSGAFVAFACVRRAWTRYGQLG